MKSSHAKISIITVYLINSHCVGHKFMSLTLLIQCPVRIYLGVFSVGFEVDIGSWEVDVAEAKCQRHFAETGTLTE